MWAWNVTRDLIRAVGLKPIPDTVSADTQPRCEVARVLETEPVAGEVHCIKVHTFVNPCKHDCLVIGPWRDLYEAALSFIRFQGATVDAYIRSIRGPGSEVARYVHLYRGPAIANLLPIPYPRILSDAAGVVRDIAKFIGADVDDADIARIVEAWSRPSVERRIGTMLDNGDGEALQDQSGRVYDPVTGFSSNHFAPDKPLVLSDEQEAQLRNALSGAMARAVNRARKEREADGTERTS